RQGLTIVCLSERRLALRAELRSPLLLGLFTTPGQQRLILPLSLSDVCKLLTRLRVVREVAAHALSLRLSVGFVRPVLALRAVELLRVLLAICLIRRVELAPLRGHVALVVHVCPLCLRLLNQNTPRFRLAHPFAH